MTEETRLLNSKELANYIGSTEGTIRTWQCIGKIPANWCIKIGRSVRYDRIEVEKALEICKQKGCNLMDFLDNAALKGVAYGN